MNEKISTIRCKGQKENKMCNNAICLKSGNKLTIKRHNRIIHISLSENQCVEIVCEKCGYKTVIKG